MFRSLEDRPPEPDPSPRTTWALRAVWLLWMLFLIAFTLWAASYMWTEQRIDRPQQISN